MSVFCAGTTVLLTFIVAYKAMNLVPLAALAGVMFMIVIHTFAWHSLVTIADALCYALEPLHINTTRFQLWIAKYRPAYAVSHSNWFCCVHVSLPRSRLAGSEAIPCQCDC